LDWIEHGLTSPPTQYRLYGTGDGFYRSKDPTNSIKVLKEKSYKENPEKQTTKYTFTYKILHNNKIHI